MDIVSQIYNSLYKERDDTGKSISASNTVRAAKSAEARAISTAALNPGDIFQAEVTDVKHQDVTLRVFDGSTINARLGEQIPINIGDTLQFMVKESQAEQLVLKVLPHQEQSQLSAVAEKALTANGFSLSEKNGNIAMALIDAGEPLDKASIMRLMQQSYHFPEAKLSTLISMNKLGLSVTEGNISQFESYLNGTYQLSDTLTAMADSTVSMLRDMAQTADISELIAANQQLMECIGNQETVTFRDGLEEFRQMMDQALAKEAEDAAVHTETSEPLLDEAVSKANGLSTDTPVNPNLNLTGSQSTEMINILLREGYSAGQVRDLFANVDRSETLLKQLSGMTMNMDEAGMRSMLQTEGYRQLLTDALKSVWSLQPEKMKDPKEIDRLYEKILSDSEKLSLSFGDKNAAGRQFHSQSGEMQQQMRFLQDLNQNFIYAQMPVKLSDQVANSELYVYADKKKLADVKDSISVLFHLDMESLGPTDVHVSLTGKKVHAVFTLQDQSSIRIVASNMTELAEKLSNKGLTLSHEVKKKPEALKSPVVKEMIDPDAEKSVKRYNFDVRM